MRVLETDWRAFLQILEYYRRLPYGARRFFIEKMKPSQPVSMLAAAEWLQPLLDSGLVAPSPTGKNIAVEERFRGFSRAMRACHRTYIFQSPTRDAFSVYLAEVLDGPEIAAFSGAGRQYYYYRDYQAVQSLYGRVCSADWVKRFLAATSTDWEVSYLAPGHTAYFTSTAVLHAAQSIIRALVPGAAPVPMAQLPGMIPNVNPEALGEALLAGFRYLLFYPCLLGDGMEPAIGLWPGIAHKLVGQAPKPPKPVDVTDPFHSPFLVEDMTAVLSACLVDPPRIRANDGQIFEADRKALLESFSSLPGWAERDLDLNPEWRLATSLEILRHLAFLVISVKNNRLQPSSEASYWLGLNAGERLKAILAALRPPREQSLLLPTSWQLHYAPHHDAVARALLAAFTRGPEGVFVRWLDFARYESEHDNPYVALFAASGPHPACYLRGRYLQSPTSDELEEVWASALASFLQTRLIGLGCVAVGNGPAGEICIAPTAPGRYLAGLVENFDFGDSSSPGHIVVQPNFDVVFLGPSAKAEAELSRFCERKGRHVGTLFRITKASVLLGAATGVTADHALETLTRHVTGEVPANVLREIKGWFSQYREIDMIPAFLVHCPDKETATRVISAAGKQVRPLTDTVLEWHGGKPQQTTIKKLRELGVFLREH